MVNIGVNREKSPRTILGISTCMFRQCFLQAVCISRVRDEIGDSSAQNLIMIISVKGIAKVAKRLGFDYAEAVVGN